VLYGLGGRGVAKEVAAAHDAAVAAGLAYLEWHAVVSRRRVDGEIHQIRGEGLAAAVFWHRTSRAGDPQLHSHALVPNVVERIDGGTGALHSPVLYRHTRTAGFVYQAVLRGELTDRLGVTWEAVHNGYAEIDGIDRRLLDGFSKRRAEIEEAMAQRGEDSARAAQVAAHRTRTAKEYGIDPQTLKERWHNEAQELGFDPRDLVTVLDRSAVQVTERHLNDAVDDMVSPVGLTAHQATFDLARGSADGGSDGVAGACDAIDEESALRGRRDSGDHCAAIAVDLHDGGGVCDEVVVPGRATCGAVVRGEDGDAGVRHGPVREGCDPVGS
jgi:chorismate mutase